MPPHRGAFILVAAADRLSQSSAANLLLLPIDPARHDDQHKLPRLHDGDTLPEQLLVDQVSSTILDAACCQIGFAQPHRSETILRRWENRLARAQQRHQAAVQSLVELRQMLVGGVCPGEDRAEGSRR